jgi:predicted thioredoxin/glutaredoxin
MVPDLLTRQHVGILLTIAGTVLLAFSVRVKRQYSGQMARVADKLKEREPGLVELTETNIVRSMFWAGLTSVAIGTLLEW